MGRLISGLFLIGVLVMVFTGRVSWLSGGGVLMPHLSATFESAAEGRQSKMVLVNTGTETLFNLELAPNRWKLNSRRRICGELKAGERVEVPISAGEDAYVFASRYLLPATFRSGR